ELGRAGRLRPRNLGSGHYSGRAAQPAQYRSGGARHAEFRLSDTPGRESLSRRLSGSGFRRLGSPAVESSQGVFDGRRGGPRLFARVRYYINRKSRTPAPAEAAHGGSPPTSEAFRPRCSTIRIGEIWPIK